MMKKKTAIVLTILCALILGACGKIRGGLVDVGDFTVQAPDGWMALEQPDFLSNVDAEGNHAPRTDAIGLIKGGRSEFDTYSKPTLYIYYYANKDAKTKAEEARMWAYGEMTDLDPVMINGTECIVLEEKQESFVEVDKFYIYNYVFYPITETGCVQFTVPIDMIDFAGVRVEDADVRTIMESVALK